MHDLRLSPTTPRGMLLMEAVMASFLMVLAFLAAVKLYGASLQWEASTGKVRLATLVAERKMEEIRAQSAQIPNGSTFRAHLQGLTNGTDSTYPDAPGLVVNAQRIDLTHEEVESSGLTPTNGIHSPSTTFYTEPNGGSGPPYPSDPLGDFQLNATYESYPYSRRMPDSFRLVQVTVRWGNGVNDNVKLLSLIGDPIPPRKNTGATDFNETAVVVKESGPNNLTGGTPAVYTVEVTTRDGAVVEDVSVLWGIDPNGDGTADLFALNAAGTRVRVSRPASAESGQQFRLLAQIRYKGVEARARSEWISL